MNEDRTINENEAINEDTKTIVVGIDFGDGQTSAGIKYPDKNDVEEIPVKGRGSKIINSDIYKNECGEWTIAPKAYDIKDIVDNERTYGSYFKSSVAYFLKCYNREVRQTPAKSDKKARKQEIYDIIKEVFDNKSGSSISELRETLSGAFKSIEKYKESLKEYEELLDEDERSLGTVCHNVILFMHFVDRVYKNIKKNIRDQGDNSYIKIYAACPTGWTEIKSYYKLLLKAASIPCEDVIEESRAAFIDCRETVLKHFKDTPNPGILVIDYGSSTIDFSWYQGPKHVHKGYPHGANHVEKALFYYMLKHENKARTVYEAAKEAIDPDVLDKAIIRKLREIKEEFYSSLVDSPNRNAFLNSLSLSDISTKINGEFGFDKNEESSFRNANYDARKVETILKSPKEEFSDGVPEHCCKYIDKFETVLQEIKEEIKKEISKNTTPERIYGSNPIEKDSPDKKGGIDRVILVGAASQMDFVRSSVKSKLNLSDDQIVNGRDTTLSVSRGITQYGVFWAKAKPICDRIEESIQQMTSDSKNEKSLNHIIKKECSNFVKEKYTQIFESDLQDWVNGYVGFNPAHTLDAEFSDILSTMSNSNNIWRCVNDGITKDREKGNISLHALFRRNFDSIDKQEATLKISSEINAQLSRFIQNEIGSLFEEYWKVYSPDADLPEGFKIEIQNLNLDVKIDFPNKLELLKNLIDNSFNKVSTDWTRKFTERTLNKGRKKEGGFHQSRLGLMPILKEVYKNYAKDVEKASSLDKKSLDDSIKQCKLQINNCFAELKRTCTLESYNTNNAQYDI